MVSVMVRVHPSFKDKLDKEHRRVKHGLEVAGKKGELSFVEFTRMCGVVAPSIAIPSQERSGKKIKVMGGWNNISKLI